MQYIRGMNHLIALDMYVTAGVGVLALILGLFFTRVIPPLKRFCIPAPVSGGILLSLLTLLLHWVLRVDFSFDGTIKEICMMLFFTSVGFQSDMKVLRKGGRPLVVMIILVLVLIVLQNLLSVGIARAMGLGPLLGMATGSIPMSGGHGTAGGFSPVLLEKGLAGADSITLAAATFGLVAGSLIGGPLGESLIRRFSLSSESGGEDVFQEIEPTKTDDSTPKRRYTLAACQLILAMALGMGLYKLLLLTGITFPTYFGALLVGVLIRNVFPHKSGKPDPVCQSEITSIGNICLSLFLGMAMSTLKLWELAGLMLPLLVILLAQALLIVLYGYFVAFRALGKDYDGAVLVSGLCGFGLGATPNAMANMSAICYKYHYSVKPFIIVPIIGAMFVDIINTGVITLFLNLI